MKKLILILPLVILVLAGCTEEGTLIIESDSSEQVWYEIDAGTTHYLYTGEADEYSWDLSSGVSGEDTKEVVVDYGGGYWFFYDYMQEVEIKPGKEKTITIIGDAGEIEIWNDSNTFYIYYAYLSPSSDATWGDDDLGADIIAPGESVIWKVSVGEWDVKIVDDYDEEFVSYNNYIAPEERTTFYYDGFKRSDDPDGEKLKNSQTVERVTKDLAEKR